jgi:PAS domain S-box-containing protein
MQPAQPPPVVVDGVVDATLLRLLIDRVVDYAMFVLSPKGIVLSWNDGARRLKGYTPREIIGHSFEEFYTPEDRAAGKPLRLLNKARTEGRIEDEGWRVRKDGTRFWADVIITALRDDDGRLVGFAKVTRDLTDRRATEERLRQSEQRFRTLVDTIKDYAIFLLSPEGIILTWNQGAERLKGYRPDEIIGRHLETFYTPEDRARGHAQHLLALARDEGRIEHEGWRVRKDGTRFWADVVITALHDDAGHLVGYAKVTRDLTERRQAEAERTRREAAERVAERMERLQSVTAALAAVSRVDEAAEVLGDVGTLAVGATGGVVAFVTGQSETAVLEIAEARGYLPEQLQRGDRLVAYDPYPLSYAWRTGRAVFIDSREQVVAEYPELAPVLDRSTHAAWAAVPLSIGKRLIGIFGISFEQPRTLNADERSFLLALAEVSAQAIDRARLYESEQHARAEAEDAVRAQDEFLSIASHELRTPVAAVKATAQLAQRSIQRGQFDAQRTEQYLVRITRAADRLGGLVEDLLDVSRLRTGQIQLRPKRLNLGALVDDTLGRYRSTEPRHTFSVGPCPIGELTVLADPLRIEQVLDNLLSNAVKYSPDGGEVVVGACREADGVLLTVTDHGIGLPVGQETRIFEAFGRASNAAAQQIPGLGLGLAICRQLVEAHGGRMWATSPGEQQGTTVGVWLPKAPPPDDDHDNG